MGLQFSAPASDRRRPGGDAPPLGKALRRIVWRMGKGYESERASVNRFCVCCVYS
jgi:hypothetical protein